MSHFNLLIITKNPNEDEIANRMEFYDEANKYKNIVSMEELIKRERDSVKVSFDNYKKLVELGDEAGFNAHYKEHLISFYNKYKNWGDKEYYDAIVNDYLEDDGTQLLSDGSLAVWENPDAKHDWYIIGGRWENMLIDKEGTACNIIKKSECANIQDIKSFAVLNDNGWHDIGKMGWFGMSDTTEEEEEKWYAEYYDRFILPTQEDYYFVMVDCHI